MITRAFEQKADGEDLHCKHDWVPIEEISPKLQKAVIASEDGILSHHGFDFRAMYQAYKSNSKGKRIKAAVP
jgi:monofunctional biosynthetic peptidoglycan transglycosylase